jgi:hypothetical protein
LYKPYLPQGGHAAVITWKTPLARVFFWIGLMALTIGLAALAVQGQVAAPASTSLTIELLTPDGPGGESQGQGVLTLGGNDYPFQVRGLSAVNELTLGSTVVGNVYHLSKVADFAGNYTAAQSAEFLSSRTIAGANVLMVENRRGVLIHLFSQEGGQLHLDPEGLTITLP